ncbi:MAG: LamG-like jellyroll fold domain-containing protein [Leptospirales bacterium]
MNKITTIFKGDGSLIFSETELDIAEGALAGNFNITLAAKPTHDVSVSLAVSDDTEIIISPENITFTSDDYDIPRVIVVYGIADCTTDGDQNSIISVTEVTSKDTRFRSSSNSYLLVNEVDVTIRDNALNVPELLILSDKTTLETSESGANDKFLVSLSCAPSANVTVNLASSNLAEGILDTATVNLDADNYATGQLVTVTGQSDCTLEPDQNYSITANIVLAGLTDPVTDLVFSGLNDSINVTNANVEMTKQLMISSAGAQMNRGTGSFNNFQVKLSCDPGADFDMTVVVNNLGSYTLHSPSPSPHTFLTADWATPVDIITEVTSDLDGAYSITLTPLDGSYPAETVYFTDSPTKRITITTAGLAAGESYEIQNFTDKKDIGSDGASIWWAVNGDPYAFKISRQPIGQVCGIKEKQDGTVVAVMSLTINCASGYPTSQNVIDIAQGPLDYRLYQGKVTDAIISWGAVAPASLSNPAGLVYLQGDIKVITDTSNGRLLKLDAAGTMSELIAAGTLVNGIALSAPRHPVTDGVNLYFSDNGNSRVLKVDMSGNFLAEYSAGSISGLAIDVANQILYMAVRNASGTIKRLDLPTGIFLADIIDAKLTNNEDLVLLNGDLYVTVIGHDTIVKVTDPGAASESIDVFAGIVDTAGFQDGDLLKAKFTTPHGITTDGTDLYVTDSGNHRIRKIDLSKNIVTTIAGAGAGSATGVGVAARFINPLAVVSDGRNFYIADLNSVYKITDNGLVGYWPLGSAQPGVTVNANDYNSDNATQNTGTLGAIPGVADAADPSFVANSGRYGTDGAFSFDGGDYISATDTNLPMGTAPRTMCAWAKPTSYPGLNTHFVIAHYGGGAVNEEFNIGISNIGQLKPGSSPPVYDIDNQTVSFIAVDSTLVRPSGALDYFVPSKIPLNKWSHICATYNGSEITLLVNGKQIGTATRGISTTPSNFSIGARGVAHKFEGSIADVRIYNRVLNDGEINELAQDADSAQVSNSSYSKGATGLLSHYELAFPVHLQNDGPLLNLTASSGTSTTGKDGDASGADIFNADTSQFLSGPDTGLPMNAHPRTMCTWLNPYSYPAAGSWGGLIGYGKNANTLQSALTIYNDGAGNPGLITFDIEFSDVTSTVGVPLHSWSHVCVTLDINKLATLYLNGSQVGNGTLSSIATDATGGTVYLGSDFGAGSYFDGIIDDVRIYNNALSADQIRQLAVQVPSGLVAHYDFTGDKKDASGWGNDLSGNAAYTATGDRFGAGAYTFNGSQSLTNTNSTSLPLTNQARTMCAWFKPKNYPTSAGVYSLVTHGATGANLGHTVVLRDIGGVNELVSGYWTVNDAILKPYNQYTADTWQHFCATHSTTENKLYLNGLEVANGTPNTLTIASSILYLGTDQSSYYFKGSLDDVRVYNRALGPSEIKALVQQPNKKLMVTAATHSGDFINYAGGVATGIAGADAMCQAEFGTTYKALIVDDINRRACTTGNCITGTALSGITQNIDWVLRPNVTYTRPDGIPLFTADGNGVWNFATSWYSPYSASLQIHYTGLTGNWLTNATTNLCQGWTSPIVTDTTISGREDRVDSTSISFGVSNCSVNYSLYCVEQ